MSTNIAESVREAGRTAFLRHKGLTSACVDAAIDAAVMADRAARAPDPSREMLVEALDKADKLIGFWSDYRSLPSDEFLAKYTLDRETSSLRMTELALQYRESRAALSAIEASK